MEPEITYEMTDEPQDYHDLPGLSHSRMKLLRRNPKLFQKAVEQGWKEESKKHHIDGDIIDKVMLDFAGFKKKYVPQTWSTPSSNQQSDFANMVASGEDILIAYDHVYKQKLKPETLKKKAAELYENLEEHINFVRAADGRIPYDPKIEQTVMGIQNSAMNHPRVSKLLNHPGKKNHVVVQTVLFGVPVKIEVDLLISTNVQGVDWLFNIDLKSTRKNLGAFPYQYITYGYHNQQALYEMVLTQWAKENLKNQPRILTFCIAAEKVEPFSVGLYRPHVELLQKGKEWVKESIELYKKHDKLGFEYPISTYEKGMEIIYPSDYQKPEEEENNS